MSRYLSRSSSRAPGAGRKRAYDDAVGASRASARRPRVVPPPARRRSSTSPSPGSCSRTSASPTSGRCPGTTCARSTTIRGRYAHGRPGARPCAHPQGSRLPAGRDRPGRLPRRRAAAHDRARRTDPIGDGDATPSDAQRAGGRKRAAQLHLGHGRRAGAHRAEDPRVVAITAGMPTGTGLASSGPIPGTHVRRGHRRAARHDPRHGPRARRPAAVRGALFHVPPARLRPGRPRRLPERRAGGHRRRPRRARGRGRHQPPGHVHAARPAPAAQPGHRLAQGRAAAAPAAAHRIRRRTTRSRSTTRATRASTCRRSSRRPSPSGRARCCARATTCSSWASGRS